MTACMGKSVHCEVCITTRQRRSTEKNANIQVPRYNENRATNGHSPKNETKQQQVRSRQFLNVL